MQALKKYSSFYLHYFEPFYVTYSTSFFVLVPRKTYFLPFPPFHATYYVHISHSSAISTLSNLYFFLIRPKRYTLPSFHSHSCQLAHINHSSVTCTLPNHHIIIHYCLHFFRLITLSHISPSFVSVHVGCRVLPLLLSPVPCQSSMSIFD